MLNAIWFLLVAVLITVYAILDGFDLGVGNLHLLARTDEERRTLLKAIGPMWDGNEVWLLTGGGALFAAFAPVYATVFSGFYLAMMLVLVALIMRATAVEFRNKMESASAKGWFDRMFFLGSFLASVLFGVAVGNLMRGIPIDEAGRFTGTFLGLLNPYSVFMGLLSLSMFTLQGATYLALRTGGDLQRRAAGWAWKLWALFVGIYVVAALWTFGVSPHLYHKYYAVPWHWVSIVLFVAAVAALPVFLRKGRFGMAFVCSSLSIAGLTSTLALAAFPLLAPSSTSPDFSLTAYNASSSDLTLKTMLVLALIGVPIVLAYTVYIYVVFKGKVDASSPGY
jgi:cytochrome bd ubiquinol oxidase subunit II